MSATCGLLVTSMGKIVRSSHCWMWPDVEALRVLGPWCSAGGTSSEIAIT